MFVFHNLKKYFLVIFFSLVSFVFFDISVFAATATLTYDFSNDNASSTPAFITPVSTGAVITTEYSSAFSSNVAEITDYAGFAPAIFSLDDFPESDYQQIVWKNGYSSNLFRQGVYLRASVNGDGLPTGYLFQISPNLAHGRVFSVLDGAITTLASPTFSGQGNNTKRYYRATADGDTLTFERSTNGSTWVSLASVTNSNYTSGGVYLGEGYGAGSGQSVAGNAYIDNITYTYEDTFDVSVTAPSEPQNVVATFDTDVVDIVWDLPTSNGGSGITDYKIEYKTSAEVSWTTYNDGVSKTRSASVEDLVGGYTYNFRVSAINSAGAGDPTASDPIDIPVFGTITLTSPTNYQVFQRDENDIADITISGTYTDGPPGTVEARFAGGTWTVIDANPAGGTFSGTLSDQVISQGDLEVRFSSNTSITDSAQYVGVGDIYIVAGQSNASGRGTNNQSYSHATLRASLFGNDDNWKNLTDPHDRSAGQIDAVSIDELAGGSFPPLLATYILENESTPVAFVPVALGGTAMEAWDPSGDLYIAMVRRFDAAGGSIKAVLWFQGESDSSEEAVIGYEDQLSEFVDAVYEDFNAKTVIGMLGSAAPEGNGRSLVRFAQRAVVESNPNAVQGPAMYDVNIDNGCDGTHFCGDEDLAIFAERWWYALSKEFYDGTDGFGPIVVDEGSYYSVTDNAVYLEFTDDSDPIIDTPYVSDLGDAFSIYNGVTYKSVSSAEYIDDKIIKLNLGSSVNVNLDITANYVIDNRGGIDNAIYDSLGMPALNFEDLNIEVGSLPGSVSSLDATPGLTSVALTWTAPSVVVPVVNDYEIDYKLSSDVSWTNFSESVNTTASTTVTGLTSDTSYDFRVRAVNNMGNGEYLELLNISTDAEEEPVEEEPEVSSAPVIISSGSYSNVINRPLKNKLDNLPILKCLRDKDLIKLGNKGQSVNSLQFNLLMLGFNPGPMDGIFGKMTLTAVRNYQQNKGLLVDGLVGNNTKNAMNISCGV